MKRKAVFLIFVRKSAFFLFAPHFSVCKTGDIFRFLELPCKITLIVESAQMSNFFNRFVGKTQKLLSIINTTSYNMLKNCLSVYFFIFTREVEFAYVKIGGYLLQRKILTEILFNI